MARARQQQTVRLKRGLFLVRYAAAEDKAQPPRVKVAPDPPSNPDISFYLHPDHSEPMLWQPDTCLVVRATAPGQLVVEVDPAPDGGSVAATVRIEPLNQGTAAASPAKSKVARRSSFDLKTLRVLGHVGGIGDVIVNANEWVAGPAAPARIEGLAIQWPDKPADLEIRYAAKTAQAQLGSGRAVPLGSFAGTRGKAMPIVGVMLELAGSAAAHFQFFIETIFLGALAQRMRGKRLVVSGPTGREPLVGLRLALEPVRAAETLAATATGSTATGTTATVAKLAAATTATPPQAKSVTTKSKTTSKTTSKTKSKSSTGRIRVFRSRSQSKQPEAV